MWHRERMPLPTGLEIRIGGEVSRGDRAVLGNGIFAMDDAAPVRMAIAPVVVSIDNGANFRGVGTAFCIAAPPSGKAVYVTAEHVASELIPPGLPDGAHRTGFRDGSTAWLLLPARESRALVRVRIEAVTIAGKFSDLALLRVEPWLRRARRRSDPARDDGAPEGRGGVLRARIRRHDDGGGCPE